MDEDAFIGEIRPFAFGYLPPNWLACNGARYPITQHQALFAIIGYEFGGEKNSTFCVPALAGVALVGAGQGPDLSYYPFADVKGIETVILDSNNLPPHSHSFNGATATSTRTSIPADEVSFISNFGYTSTTGQTVGVPGYVKNPPTTPDTTLAPDTIGVTGGGLPHENRQPGLAIIYGICNVGEFPSKP